MLRHEELTEPERAVWDAIETGAPVVLTTDDPATGDAWGKDRQIRAELLYQLLAGGDGPKDGRPRALRLAGARISGTLDLEAATLVCPLTLLRCSFEQPINLQEAQAPTVRLRSCHAPGLQGDQLQTRGDLELTGFTTDGEVRLVGGHIGGTLDLRGATLTNPDGFALNADGLTVDQSMFCDVGFTAQGEVRLPGGHIGSQLSFGGATLTNPKGHALNAQGLTVDQSMFCDQGFTARGDVSLISAHIGSQLSFRGATLTNPDGFALTADGLTVAQDMLCDQGFTAQGEVRLVGGHISNLEFDGATLINPKGLALNADKLTVDQSMLCRSGFTVQGEVNLVAAHIGSQLSFRGATLTNPQGRALNADELAVDQSMLCDQGFTAQGGIRLVAAHISNLQFSGATLINPKGRALLADGLTVDQNMFCDSGFTGQGEVSLISAHIGSQLSFAGATLTSPAGIALRLERVRAATLLLRPTVPPEGTVDLTEAHVDTCYDSHATWPQDLRLGGFTYRALVAKPEVDAAARLRWLERDPGGYTPQLYEQLAAAYRTAGRDDDTRRVAIAKQRRRRETLNWPGKWWNSLLRWTVGYGYQIWKAGVWLVVLVGLGWWVFDYAHPAHLSAAKPPGQRPWFHAGLYALDLLLPFADLGYQGAWIADGWARLPYLGWNVAGWVLVTAVVAALSGLIKRD